MSLYKVLPLIQAVISFALMLLIVTTYKRRPHKVTNYVFTLYLLFMTVWASFIFLMRSSSNIEQAYHWEKFVIPFCILTQALIYHFSIFHSGINVRKWLPISIYLIVICIGVIGFFKPELIITKMYFTNSKYIPSVAFPVTIFGLSMVFLTIFNFWKTTRKKQTPVEKNRNLYVFWGFLLCIVLGIFDLIPRLPAGSIIGNILFCSVTTFAVIKYQLLDIHVVFRRGISYILMSSTIAIPYVFLMYLVMDVWGITIPLPVLIISLIVLAGLLHPLWRSIQTLVNKSYYRKKYDYLLELRIFAAETHDISDIKTLTDTTIKLLEHVFQTEGIYILTPTVTDNYEIIGYSNKKPINLFIPKDNAIIKLMLNTNKILSIYSLNTQYSLPADEVLKQFNEVRIELIVPLKSLKNNLAGIILIGEKLSGRPYIQSEEKLIFAISKRIAPEFENAHLYNLELAMRQELEKQARLKSEFLHSVAHELKTPLTAIISSSESIIEFSSARLDKKEEKLLKNISTNAWSLDKRVSELLDFARYETTTASLNFQSFKLESLLRKAVSKYSYQFKKKEQILDVNISKCLPTIRGDIDKLQQVMFNLISNANKLSPENSHIYLRIYLRDSKIFIEIEDSAPTIKDTGKIFDPYSISEKTGSTSGLGLELASAKSLIELHKGEIHVENKQPIGNTFVVSLPIEIK